jgi:hypothetical protein
MLDNAERDSKQVLPDPTPYAQKAGDDSACKAGGSIQAGDGNTMASTKTDVIDTGRFTDENSLQVPGSVEPYANETRTVATREDCQADVGGGHTSPVASGRTNPAYDALDPHGYGGDGRWS